MGRWPSVSRRGRVLRPLKQTVLILGEGRETEPNYFRQLRLEPTVSRHFAVTVKKGPGFSPKAVVEAAIADLKGASFRGKRYDEVWCVLDFEGQQNLQSLDEARALARRAGITICVSHPSFEVWFLAHFARIARAFRDSDDVLAYLAKFWRKHCGNEYRKNAEDNYDRIAKRTGEGIKNARWVREVHHKMQKDIAHCNSATEVYLLVEHLLS